MHKGHGRLTAKLSATCTACVFLCLTLQSCYVSGQNIGCFPQCDESAFEHQSFMRHWFLSDAKVVRCSSLQLQECVLDLGGRDETGAIEGKRTRQSCRPGPVRLDWQGWMGEGIRVMERIDEERMMTVPLAQTNVISGYEWGRTEWRRREGDG